MFHTVTPAGAEAKNAIRKTVLKPAFVCQRSRPLHLRLNWQKSAVQFALHGLCGKINMECKVQYKETGMESWPDIKSCTWVKVEQMSPVGHIRAIGESFVFQSAIVNSQFQFNGPDIKELPQESAWSPIVTVYPRRRRNSVIDSVYSIQIAYESRRDGSVAWTEARGL